jgi:hypothetical protein
LNAACALANFPYRTPSPMSRLFAILMLITSAFLPLTAGEKSAADLGALAAALRPIILGALPKPLYEKSDNWGNTTLVANQLKWHGLRPKVIKAPKNDGNWRKTTVTARDPAGSLEFHLSDLKSDGADRQTFKAFLALMVHVDHEEEIWEKGLRLYRDTTEVRVRIMAQLDIETSIRLEANPKSFLPDTVFRLRVLKANVSYDNLVVEHIAGIGGTGARLFGETIRSTLKQWKPSIERELLAKANAAIVKAADTREVRISLSSLLPKK